MKKILRVSVLVLCFVMVFSMFPVQADAASSNYSTLSTKTVLLEFPTNFLDHPMHAKVEGVQKDGGIYYVPKPEEGNGNLGIAKDGTNVTIFAEENGYYFFMTNSGRMGWNKTVYFTEPEDFDDYNLPGNSGLNLGHIDEVLDFLRDNEKAGGSVKYYPSKSVVIVEKGETEKITIFGKYKYKSSTRFYVNFWGDYCKPSWKSQFANGKATLAIRGKDEGTERLYFSTNYTDKEFEVLVLVI